MNFYASSCSKAEQIVLDYVKQHIPNAPSLAASFLRMHFHDCIVRGCDASVLLNSTSGQAEKNAVPILTLRGFDFIERVKSLLEAECPGVVSCADILTLVARDSVVTTGGPFWNVPTGRRDGMISNITEENTNIPSPFHNFTTLLTLFSGHTIGISLCPAVSRRLYNSTGPGGIDPPMDSKYAENLKANKCKIVSDSTTILEMDPGGRKTFDFSYYSLLLKRRGLFQSDAALTTDLTSLAFINQLLTSPPQFFFNEFSKAMEKMGRVNVKTGSEGQIRKQCALVNN
ncbi:peroxidase 3-like [Gossypium australe]|uniref:Peroxidase n=1 Tax=Gossypium australe TaxID=47621 RepID=A0A5B6X107_9ROSI|nr:peroxidase 3-like [Gossypium australe]